MSVHCSDRPKEFRPKAERDIFETPISAESRKWPKGRISAERSNFGRNFHFRLGTEVISAEIGRLEVLISAENAYFGRNFSFGISAKSDKTFR